MEPRWGRSERAVGTIPNRRQGSDGRPGLRASWRGQAPPYGRVPPAGSAPHGGSAAGHQARRIRRPSAGRDGGGRAVPRLILVAYPLSVVGP